MPLQVLIAVGIVGIAISTMRPTAWIAIAVLVSFGSGLVRRLLAGPTGRIDNDPLVVVPLVLVLAAVVCFVVVNRKQVVLDWLTLVFLGVSLSIVVVVLITGRLASNELFAAAAHCIPWLLAAGVRSGLVPDVWPRVARLLPGAAVVIGLYGVFQFGFLPSWDRQWLLQVGTASFGSAEPFKVRIWGMSDSPAPYAAILGLCIVSFAHTSARRTGRTQLGWIALCLAVLVPLVLTGVRLSFVAVVVGVVLVGLAGSRGMGRVVPVLLVAAAGGILSFVVSAFGGGSVILNSDRLTSFNPSTDVSLQTRLDFVHLVPQAIANPFGSGTQPGNDNLFVDVLISYGPLPAAFLLVAVVGIAAAAIRQLATQGSSAAPVCVIFLVIFALGSNILISSVGVLAAVAFGSVALTGKPHTAVLSSASV